MSRYSLFNDGDKEAVVGWDRPLQTFFLQVFVNPGKDEEETVVWEGMQYGKLPTLNDLERVLEHHGIALTAEMRSKLQRDFAEPYEPSPLQKMLREKGIVK